MPRDASLEGKPSHGQASRKRISRRDAWTPTCVSQGASQKSGHRAVRRWPQQQGRAPGKAHIGPMTTGKAIKLTMEATLDWVLSAPPSQICISCVSCSYLTIAVCHTDRPTDNTGDATEYVAPAPLSTLNSSVCVPAVTETLKEYVVLVSSSKVESAEPGMEVRKKVRIAEKPVDELKGIAKECKDISRYCEPPENARAPLEAVGCAEGEVGSEKMGLVAREHTPPSGADNTSRISDSA